MNAPIINVEDRGLILVIAKEIFIAMSNSAAGVRQIGDYHFDRNFRPEIVPTWGRNPNTLTGCLLEMNRKRSHYLYRARKYCFKQA